MGNQLDSNPLRIDTAATHSGIINIRQIQWVDLNEDIVDSDELIMEINGVTVQCEIQIDGDDLSLGQGAVAWSIGPFNPGINVKNFQVTTIESGVVYVWI